MNTLKKITTLFLVSISFNLLAQDSLLQVELTFYPLCHKKSEDYLRNDYLFKNKYNYGPSLTITFPLKNKLSLSTGLNFKIYTEEYYFKDSIELIDVPGTGQSNLYRSYFRKSTFDLLIPVFINYKLYQYKKISFCVTGGLEVDLWYFSGGISQFYPLEPVNVRGAYSYSFNSFSDMETYNLNVNATLKYFPIKHLGVLIKPFANYNLAFDKYSLTYGLGVGICYR
jgi:hypothetical protein